MMQRKIPKNPIEPTDPLHKAMRSLTVAVVNGGWSHEANLTFDSAPHIEAALHRLGHRCVVIDYRDSALIETLKCADVVFPQTMGEYGEDGVFQGLLDYLDCPYVGSGVTASAICANKQIFTTMVKGIATDLGGKSACRFWSPKGIIISHLEKFNPELITDHFSLPVIVKPLRSGASFGITRIEHENDFAALPELLAEYRYLLCEEWIQGEEYSVGFVEIDGKWVFLPPWRIPRNPTQLQTNESKLSGAALHEGSAERDSGRVKHLNNVLSIIARHLGLNHFTRMDLIVDADGIAQILEINTLPGINPDKCIFPAMCLEMGISYDEMIAGLLDATTQKRPMHVLKYNAHRQP